LGGCLSVGLIRPQLSVSFLSPTFCENATRNGEEQFNNQKASLLLLALSTYKTGSWSAGM